MTDLSSIADAKRALRGSARKRRAGIDPARREAAALKLASIGLSFVPLHQVAVVSGYHPLRDEIDPRPLMEQLTADGVATALPAHAPGSLELSFHLWQPGEPLVAGDFSVLMPDLTAQSVDPDVLLVPLLAFDAEGHRLGYGAGYFDRALARLRSSKRVTAIGVGFDEQEVDEVPHDSRDQRLDWILTPAGPRKLPG